MSTVRRFLVFLCRLVFGFHLNLIHLWFITSCGLWPDRAPSRQFSIGGVKGHNMNEISFPGSPALWAGSFTFLLLAGR